MCEAKRYKNTSNTHIDSCMLPLIKFLTNGGYDVVACCCGHSKYNMSVVAKFTTLDGYGDFFFKELLSDTNIPRFRKFYKRNKEGLYFIPEIENKKTEDG